MRKIIHIDMDAFFAAVEQRDFPELRGRPVVVGGDPQSRGVVATCSYEARRYGIHSAMPTSHAYRLCPHAVFVRPRFQAYKDASVAIQKIFHEYTDLIEPLSLDEAYLDVTGQSLCEGSATLMAQQIRKKIYDRLSLTASAGVSYNKFLAKLASDQNKPDGQFVIVPGEAISFLDELPIGRFYGVGKVTEGRMNALGIFTGADLRRKSLVELQNIFGHSAEYYHDICRGIDHRPVSNRRIRKSLGSETTFQQDITDRKQIQHYLLQLAQEVCHEMALRELYAYTVTIKIKYADFRQVTRSSTDEVNLVSLQRLARVIPVLLDKTSAGDEAVRLLGISFSNLVAVEDYVQCEQLELF